MPTKTKNFQLEYFRPGSVYSAASDYRRFATIDYNLESFIGIVGVGVISGFGLSDKGGLTVGISHGKGIINGHAAESPYSVRRRSHMDSGDVEVEIVRFDDIPEPYMTDDERTAYIDIVREYDPTYGDISNPCPNPIENVFVKVFTEVNDDPARASRLTLPDNTDSYIYAEFPENWTPYPQLSDPEYTSLSAANKPEFSDYQTYDEYLVALAEYNEDIAAYQNYKWQLYEQNHFTEVVFKRYSSRQVGKPNIFLGIVTTRSGVVSSIDISLVESLANLEATLKKKAKSFITKHVHGGGKEYDPPKINLETDIRECFLSTYNPSTGVATFDIAEKKYSSLTSGHKHSYIVDANGDGQTIEHFGNGVKHFHKIIAYEVLAPEKSYDTVSSHSHDITNGSETLDGWTSANLFNVYIGDKLLGNQDSSFITLDVSTKKIQIGGGAGIGYNKFSCEFNAYGKEYAFSIRAFNAYSFMLMMIANYKTVYANELLSAPADSPINIEVINDITSQSLILECHAADKMLTETGASFVFSDDVANGVYLNAAEVINKYENQKTTIEILGNSEVSGIIRLENVVFINAQKIISGKFSLDRIPFISHIGRTNEQFSPQGFPMASKNGNKFYVLPQTTEKNYGHFHNVIVSISGDGNTKEIIVNGDSVIYANDSAGKTYDISHAHIIKDFDIGPGGTTEFQKWSSTFGQTDPKHTHGLGRVAIGDGKTIYSIAEDSLGNFWLGTSDGLVYSPSAPAYSFNIDGEEIFRVGGDLWTLLNEAAAIYQRDTEKALVIPDEYEAIIAEIQEEIIYHNQYSFVYLPSDDISPTTIMIKKIDYIHFRNAYLSESKKAYEITADDIVLGLDIYNKTTGETIALTDEDLPDLIYNNQTYTLYNTQRNIDTIPVWSVVMSRRISADSETLYTSPGDTTETEDVNIVGSNVAAFNYLIERDFSNPWGMINIEADRSILKKAIILKNGDTWIAANNSIFITRTTIDKKTSARIPPPENSFIINDILEDGDGSILLATDAGVFRTNDQGVTWTKETLPQGEYRSISRDYTLDRTTEVSGHVHRLNVNVFGDGFTETEDGHLHTVYAWGIETEDAHTHEILSVIYLLKDDGSIFYNQYGGGWEEIGKATFNEIGKMQAFNSSLYFSTEQGLYELSTFEWSQKNKNIPYSFSLSFDLKSLYVGYHNFVDKIDILSDSETLLTFDGNPQSLIKTESGSEYFKYSISNRNSTYYFEESPLNNKQAVGVFDIWEAKDGWDSTKEIEVYYNGWLVYSKAKGVDKRGETIPYFNIDADNGRLDFSAKTQLTETANIYDDSFTLESTNGLTVGDKILVFNCSAEIVSEIFKETNNVEVDPNTGTTEQYDSAIVAIQENIAAMVKYNELAQENAGKAKEQKEQYQVFEITSVSNLQIGITPPVGTVLPSGCKAIKILPFAATDKIEANIFSPDLFNIGTISHKEIEDKVYQIETGMPRTLSSTYISNILQLSQAAKYAYSDITSLFRNSLFFDMTDYEQYIDTYNTYINASDIFDSKFSPKKATKINYIYIGTGSFSDLLFVGTDIGLFWNKISDSKEANWVKSPNLNVAVYSIRTHLTTNIMVGTEDGMFLSSDLNEWTKLANGAADFPCHDLGLRWSDESLVEIESVYVEFDNYIDVNGEEKGILFVSGDVSDIEADRTIQVFNGTTKIGTYQVSSVSMGEIRLKESILPLPSSGTHTISMSFWWNEFDQEENKNSNLTNPVIAAGKNNISVCIYPNNLIWQAAVISGIEGEFVADNLVSTSLGSKLATISSISDKQSSAIIKSSDMGTKWGKLREFGEIQAKILNFYITTDGHTKLKIELPPASSIQNGTLRLQKAYVQGVKNEFRIIWNEADITTDSQFLYIYGTEIIEAISDSKTSNTITIFPLQINSIAEYNKEVYCGTNSGVWSDRKTFINNLAVSATITGIANSGTITSFDKNGKIGNVSLNNSGQVIISLKEIDFNIYENELAGCNFMVRNNTSKLSSRIVSNSSSKKQNEVNITLEAKYDAFWANAKGKMATIIFPNSKLYLSIPNKIKNGEFKEGTIFIILSSSNSNAKAYSILDNSEAYIQIVGEIEITNLVKEGSRVLVLNKSGEIKLYTVFDSAIEDMDLNGLEVQAIDSEYSAAVEGPITIKRNFQNQIILNQISFKPIYSTTNITNLSPFVFKENHRVNILGHIFKPCTSFAYNKTSNNSDHYHYLNLIGAKLLGDISTISSGINPKTRKITFQNVSGFDHELMSIDETLLEGENVFFSNPLNPFASFSRKIITAAPTEIVVEEGLTEEWDTSGYNESLISQNWRISVDATTYGFTESPIYEDFKTLSMKITDTAIISTSTIKVQNSALFSTGDKVKISSFANNIETNEIESILDAETLGLKYQLRHTYVKNEDPYVNKISDSFANDHTHKIRKNRVETINVQAYHSLGYPLNHSHETEPIIRDVSSITASENIIAVAGNSSKIVYSDDGNGWRGNIDLKNSAEKGTKISSVQKIIIDPTGGFIAAGNDMHLYHQKFTPIQAENMNPPYFD